MLLFAIGHFHHTNNVREAQDYLEEKITKNFKIVSDLPTYFQKLQVYAREFKKLGNVFIRVRDNITISTLAQYADIVVSGQAARIDLVPSRGYAVWIFVRDVPDWGLDPRMPLLQLAYSQRLAVNLDEVSVGVYDFIAGGHSARLYSQAEIDTTTRNLLRLLRLFKQQQRP
jgi:hypothetical protein